MTDVTHILRDLMTRVEALERENRELRTRLDARVVDAVHDNSSPVPGDVERRSRRWVLQRGMQAAAASVTAGVVLHAADQETAAHHSTAYLPADWVDAHSVTANRVSVTSQAGTDAVSGTTTSDNQGTAGVSGRNEGTGPGTMGVSTGGSGVLGSGMIGVHGVSTAAGYGASYGQHFNDGPGVVGDGHGSVWAGVYGRNPGASGVEGTGRTGVLGTSTSGDGVRGEGVIAIRGKASSSGYAGVFQGGKAQLRLVPGATSGKPMTGTHQKGEIYMDSTGTLFVCIVNGTPGRWKRIDATEIVP